MAPEGGGESGKGRAAGRLETRLGYRFRDRDLLLRSLTHSSYANETGQGADNEALEFLGDAVLGFLVAEALLTRFPDMDEGGLSKFKAFLVSRSNLADIARRLHLGEHVRLGKAAQKGQGRDKGSILADTLEALVAAVHLDGGDGPARRIVEHLLGEQIAGLDRGEVERKDFKTRLQEALQALGRPTPRYRVDATEGPPHEPIFHVSVLIADEVVARGKGGTKKEAEQRAARLALRLQRRSGP
jgi:ribonuclease-3